MKHRKLRTCFFIGTLLFWVGIMVAIGYNMPASADGQAQGFRWSTLGDYR